MDHEAHRPHSYAFRDLHGMALDLIIAQNGVIIGLLKQLTKEMDTMAVTVDDILADVAAQSTVDDSMVTLLSNIAQQLKDAIAAQADPAKLQQIHDLLVSEQKKISDAVTANTGTQTQASGT